MAQHPNAVRLRDGYAAFAAGDIPTVLALFSPDVLVHVGGDGPLTGVQKGHEGLMAVVGLTMEVSGGTQKFDVEHVYADDEYGVIQVRETATRAADGKTLDVHEVHLVTFDEEGRIAEFRDVPEHPDIHDDFFDGR
jgi:ketosteroid isomerase-like protein